METNSMCKIMSTFMITLNERYMRKEYKRMSKTHNSDLLDKN